MSTAFDLDLDTTNNTDTPRHSHIVDRGDDPRPATAIILDAMVNGTPLTALCGYIWVPSRDPNQFPVCPKCLEIFEFAHDFRGVA